LRNPDRVAAVAAVAAAMFLLDPDRGTRRRALIRDQAVRLTHRLGRTDALTRDIVNRGRGWVAEIQGQFDTTEVSDVVLAERVRSEIGLWIGQPRIGERPEFLQTYWAPSARLIGVTIGSAMTLYGIAQRNLLGAAMALAGTAFAARAFTNLPLARLTGIGAGRQAVTVQKGITIGVPVRTAYAVWSVPSDFPSFMSHVREVRATGPGRSRWVVDGPGGIPVIWDAIVTREEPNQLISWHTEPGSLVQHEGTVRFDAADNGETRIEIKLSYNPVLGVAGHLVALVARTDPKALMDDDLMRMKAYMETGQVPSDAAAAG